MSVLTPTEPTSAVAAALKRNSLGVPGVIYFLLSAVGSLLVVAGVIPTFFAVTGLTGAPIFFVTVAAVLGLFAAGYVAMARHIQNAGAFYAFIRWGLGRPLGVAGALVAVLAYSFLQIAIYGLFGPTMASWAADNLGWHLSWWMWSLLAWAAVMVLGLRKIGVSAKVLAVLSIIEIAVIVALSMVGIEHPGPTGLSLSALSPSSFFAPGAAGAGLVMALLGFVGFEIAPVFGEEARDHRRTVAVATYVTLIGVTATYLLASLALLAHYGQDQVAGVAGNLGPEMVFTLSSGLIGSVGRVLFLTSMFAALIAFHNAVGRYMFSLGREAVLPAVFGRAGRRSGSPWVASLVQSMLGISVICLYTFMNWDPVVQLFFWFGSTGGFGVLVLLATTSISVVGFFARDARGESLWRRALAPALAGLLLCAMVVLAVSNFSTLLGVASDSWAARLLPASYGVAALIGLLWAAVLRSRRPAVYESIGLGPSAVLSLGVGR